MSRIRLVSTNSDGTPLHASPHDLASEADTAKQIEAAWKCDLRPMGRLCQIDYYAIRDGRLVGLVEIKRRYHAHDRYADVYLNLRKWLALTIGSMCGAAPLFVVRFDDEIRWINVGRLDPSRLTIGGDARIVKSHTDIEPVILVPVDQMRVLNAWKAS